MKTITYKLTGEVNQLTIKVKDLLGKEWTTLRTGQIYKGGLLNDDLYNVTNPSFDSIKYYAFKEGFQVDDHIYVRVAEIDLVKTEVVKVEKVINIVYHWFKPGIEYTNNLTCEVV